MDTTQLRKKTKTERTALSQSTAHRMDAWIEQVRRSLPGTKVSRQILIDWIVASRSEELSRSELSELRKTLFDEVAFTQWALGKLKQARSQGMKMSLAEIVGSSISTGAVDRKPRNRKKKDSSAAMAMVESSESAGPKQEKE